MSAKYEFGSREWLDALRATFERLVAAAGPEIDRVRWSVCECYTGMPEHLHGPAGRVAWHCRIRGRTVQFELTEIDDADFKVTGDYATILPLARLRYDEDPRVLEDAARMRAEGMAAGKLMVVGDLRTRPQQLAALHDDMVAVTR